jgi:phosphatidylethanolamine-binding protein (PEBP) family uncharacterized protein
MDDVSINTGMSLSSTAFNKGEAIPVQYTCKGENISPPLNIINVPKDAKSLSLIMHDPDAPVGDFVQANLTGLVSDSS